MEQTPEERSLGIQPQLQLPSLPEWLGLWARLNVRTALVPSL